MIYITGDTHGDFRRFGTQIFPEQKIMTSEDSVLICGDFGGVWDGSGEDQYWLHWLEQKPFQVLFVDGNHENYDLLKTYPVENWKGGKIQRIRPNILHLMRGQVYELEGKKIFTFGGARSHDIAYGILDPAAPGFARQKKEAKRLKKEIRILHESIWEEEIPSADEYEEGFRNLERTHWKVDYIITHCCNTTTQASLGGGNFQPDSLTEYLEQIKQKVKYQYWFFGHYHDNRNLPDGQILLYEQMIRIS